MNIKKITIKITMFCIVFLIVCYSPKILFKRNPIPLKNLLSELFIPLIVAEKDVMFYKCNSYVGGTFASIVFTADNEIINHLIAKGYKETFEGFSKDEKSTFLSHTIKSIGSPFIQLEKYNVSPDEIYKYSSEKTNIKLFYDIDHSTCLLIYSHD